MVLNLSISECTVIKGVKLKLVMGKSLLEHEAGQFPSNKNVNSCLVIMLWVN